MLAQTNVPATASTRSAARDTTEDQAFAYLEGTLDEVNQIDALYRTHRGDEGISKFTDTAATVEALRREAPRHAYLHLATHGFFAHPRFRSALDRSLHQPTGFQSELLGGQGISGYHPGLLSGIVLAGANRPPRDLMADDGIMTAEEVSGLDLRGVELVVLSACETGLGRTAGGEGLLGLQRAFQVAGARTAIATLWEVPDQATSALMQRFYANLWEKRMGKLEALREAQLWMLYNRPEVDNVLRRLDFDRPEPIPEPTALHEPPDRTPPQSWAAFVLSGDWR